MKPMLRLLPLLLVLMFAGGLPARAQDQITGQAAVAAYVGTLAAFDQGLDVFVVHQVQLAQERAGTKEQFPQVKRDALASMIADLRDLALRGHYIATKLRCLGDNDNVNGTARFSECWQEILSVRGMIPQDLADLDRSIDVVDPDWTVRYPAEAKEIKDLHWDRVSIANGSVLILSHLEQSGSRNVFISISQSYAMADALDKESDTLERTSASMFAIALEVAAPPVDIGPSIGGALGG